MNKISAEENMRQRHQAISKIVLVDLDKTITFESNYPKFGKINPDAVKVLRSWQDAGATIIINTARVSEFWNLLQDKKIRKRLCPDYQMYEVKYDIQIWLQKNEIPFNEIWNKTGKCPCLFEVDDKAIGCPKLLDGTLDWHKIWRMGLRKLRGCRWTEEEIHRFKIIYEWWDKEDWRTEDITDLEWDEYCKYEKSKKEDQYDKEELEVFK